ncbi:MAG: Gfo/Idh/MocA family oxidoreductase, partial [Planctomycetota bacterium]|nr:Gfo/Idh/MocA family oxidoreductase [Planctomycetota bacterium]
IASPSFTHADVVGDCLKHGLHVLVEKPFALDLIQARRLVEDAEKDELVLLVSQNYRYHAESCAVRSFIRSGKAGEVGLVRIEGFNLADVGGSNYRCRIANPHLWEMAIHQLDLLRFLFDSEVERVFCALHNLSWSWYQGSACTHIWLELSNGVKVNYLGTYVARGPISSWDNSWRIEGTNGTLLWNDLPETTLAYVSEPNAEAEVLSVEPVPHAGLQGTLNELIQAIRRGSATECSGRDNLKSLAICSACEISAQQRRVVELAEVMAEKQECHQ